VAAQKVYVAPGDLDEYYLFASGGPLRPGLRVRHPIDAAHLDDSGYTPYPATGYGSDERLEEDAGRLSPGATSITRHSRRPTAD